MIIIELFAHSSFPRSRDSGNCHTGWKDAGAGTPGRAIERGTALPATPKTAARARENRDIFALGNDALDEIIRIQTSQRLSEAVNTGVPDSIPRGRSTGKPNLTESGRRKEKNRCGAAQAKARVGNRRGKRGA